MSTRPLLLTEGVPTIAAQVNTHLCRSYEMLEKNGRSITDATDLLVCRVNPSRESDTLPFTMRNLQMVGCIHLSGCRPTDYIDHGSDGYGFDTYVLFEPWAFHSAWRVARLLKGSNQHRPAQLDDFDLIGLHISLGRPHTARIGLALYHA